MDCIVKIWTISELGWCLQRWDFLLLWTKWIFENSVVCWILQLSDNVIEYKVSFNLSGLTSDGGLFADYIITLHRYMLL